MQKRNKPNSSAKKKSITSSEKSSARKLTKLDDKKIASISEQITKMNNRFEKLIDECKIALNHLHKTQAI